MDVSKYAALFLTESREHLSGCNQLLLEWEREPEATGQVGGLFRAIHTIKGMAATMGYAGLADLAHRLENLLDALRQRTVAPAPAVFQLLFRSVDALSAAVEGAVQGEEPPPDPKLAADLDAAAAGVTSARPGRRRRPEGERAGRWRSASGFGRSRWRSAATR